MLGHNIFILKLKINYTMKNQTVKCTHCGEAVDVSEALTNELERKAEEKYSKQLEANKNEMKQLSTALENQKDQFSDTLEAKLKQDRMSHEAQLKAKLLDEQSVQVKLLNDELADKTEQVKSLHQKEAELGKLKRQMDEQKSLLEAQYETKLNDSLQAGLEKQRNSTNEKHELEKLELKKQLDVQKGLTEEMKRKQEQGSMQLQGEVQELAIEDYLAMAFPLDTIDEIAKGANGADCLQTVNTRASLSCGTIYYESKRAKDFKPAWIKKFKQDMRSISATTGVLVTSVLPKGMERAGMKDQIWICTYEEFKSLSEVLRQSIIQYHQLEQSQEDQGGKMVDLYKFLTSDVFRMQIEAIVETFSEMKISLDSEKRSMSRIWKTREKQIEQVISNTIAMYGSIKGIAGNAIQVVPALELSEDVEEDHDIVTENNEKHASKLRKD